jgi:hypothetical protein
MKATAGDRHARSGASSQVAWALKKGEGSDGIPLPFGHVRWNRGPTALPRWREPRWRKERTMPPYDDDDFVVEEDFDESDFPADDEDWEDDDD